MQILPTVNVAARERTYSCTVHAGRCVRYGQSEKMSIRRKKHARLLSLRVLSLPAAPPRREKHNNVPVSLPPFQSDKCPPPFLSFSLPPSPSFFSWSDTQHQPAGERERKDGSRRRETLFELCWIAKGRATKAIGARKGFPPSSPSFLFPWNCFSPCVIPEDTT